MSVAWWRFSGATTQAVIPAFYAWAVTVAPVGLSHDASAPARGAASLGIVAVAVGLLLEKRAPAASRLTLGWGVSLGALATWVLAPEAAVDSFDAARGLAGMLGWALFAFAIASPARPIPLTSSEPLTPSRALRSPTARMPSDVPLLLLGIALALALEVPGWRVEPRDRALLLRLSALAGGLALLTGACAVAVARHVVPGDRRRPRSRLRVRAAGWLASTFVLLGAGAAYALWPIR